MPLNLGSLVKPLTNGSIINTSLLPGPAAPANNASKILSSKERNTSCFWVGRQILVLGESSGIVFEDKYYSDILFIQLPPFQILLLLLIAERRLLNLIC